MPPIAWLPFRVCDGDDEDAVGFDRVEHGVRKHAHEAAPHILLQNPPAVRRGDNFPNGGQNLSCQTFPEISSAFLVKANGFLKL
jgi:hypothetical protein